MTPAEVNFLHFSCTEEEEKKREKPKHTAAHFGGSWYPQDYPLKFEEKHLRTIELVNFLSSIIFTVALGCFIIIKGSGAAGALTQKPKNVDTFRETLS